MKTKAKRIAAAAVILCAALCAAFAWYVNDYYRAQDVEAFLTGDASVQVEHSDNTWVFDGPGTVSALAFYPGGKVEATAYAPLMRDLAAAGIDCFLIEMPFNLAVFGMDAAAPIIEAHPYDTWLLGGHSLGGAMAASFAAGNPHLLDGLVLLAAYPTSSLADSNLPVLSVYGSADTVLDLEKVASGHALMPPAYTELVIEGGNHAQFGSYGPQAGDGTAIIPPDSQRAQTVAAILALV